MSKHTPTPWVVDYGNTLGTIKSVPAGTIEGVTKTPTVAKYAIDFGGAGILPTNEQRANAAHIVKCVNLHDELVVITERLALASEIFQIVKDARALLEKIKQS